MQKHEQVKWHPEEGFPGMTENPVETIRGPGAVDMLDKPKVKWIFPGPVDPK